MNKRLFIFSNLAMSADGKIGTRFREHYPIGTAFDRKQMQTLRKKADAILFGASSLRVLRDVCTVSDKKKQPINIVLTEKLEGVEASWPFFKAGKVRRIIFHSSQIKSELKDAAEALGVSFVFCEKNMMIDTLINFLQSEGLKSLLVEGGGSTMWEFARQNLIDEYHITLVPKVIGGRTSPTLVDGEGFSAEKMLNLKLKSVKRVENELYLVYSRTRKYG